MGLMPSVVLAVALTATGPGQTDDFQGDPVTGRLYAEKVCAECHGMGSAKGGTAGRSLGEIAAMPGMTRAALMAWLTRIPHRTMPDLILPPDQARDIVAYILSLQKAKP